MAQNIDWIFSLPAGEPVWIAEEERLAQSNRFLVDLLEETGAGEFSSVETVLLPREMSIQSRWDINAGQCCGKIVALETAERGRGGQLRFVCQSDDPKLRAFLPVRAVGLVPAKFVFRTKAECLRYCCRGISRTFSVRYCDELLAALDQIQRRVKGVRRICSAEESELGASDISIALDAMLD